MGFAGEEVGSAASSESSVVDDLMRDDELAEANEPAHGGDEAMLTDAGADEVCNSSVDLLRRRPLLILFPAPPPHRSSRRVRADRLSTTPPRPRDLQEARLVVQAAARIRHARAAAPMPAAARVARGDPAASAPRRCFRTVGASLRGRGPRWKVVAVAEAVR